MVKKRNAALVYVPLNRLGLGGGKAIQGTITELGEPQQVTTKDGQKHMVMNGVISDGTSSVPIAFWNGQIKKVKVGSTIVINDAWIKEIGSGRFQITTGKYGELTVRGSSKKTRKVV